MPSLKSSKTRFSARRQSKVVSPSRIQSLAQSLHQRKKKIVFTNGTFDLIHLGHVRYLRKAKSFGDVLIVGVNTDRSVKSYKSPDRPLNHQKDRAEIVAELECVDYVVLFDDPTPLALINKIRPDVLAKGSDWKKSQIAGAREVESWDGCVKRIRLVPGKSTTRLIKKMEASA